MTTAEKKTNKIIESFKKGLINIKLVLEEGNYKLFLKQAIVVIVIFLGFRWYNAKLEAQSANFLGQIDAVQAQHKNEGEYLANKSKLLELEPRFPDISTKNDWLLRQSIVLFRDAELKPNVGAKQSENTSNAGYTVVTLPVSLEASFKELGQLLATVESRDEYLRISDFSVNKKSEPLGTNDISLSLNTIFPNEKLAPKLFKKEAK